ncbi:MAG TPA: 2OG-Fe(II) oxygenase [Burkholderiales bacterium]|nr:2OG-Fe(II) oxygenase [Burkholderiales bacterium]
MKDVIVIDQAVPAGVQDMLEGIALGDKINWFRQAATTYCSESSPVIFPVTADSMDVHGFVHLICDEKQPVSQLYPAILPVITAIPYTIKQLLRVKMNLGVYARTENPNAHGMPHVDYTNRTRKAEQLISAVYYVNDSTGDTLIFDQRFGESVPLTVKTRVPPKKGRLVVFDGELLHAGNTPKTNVPRININFNAFVYEGAQTLQAGIGGGGA